MTQGQAEVEEFCDRLEMEFGLVFDQSRREQVEEALLARGAALRLSPRAYVRNLDHDHREWEQIAALLTVPESYFFRHADHLRAFIEVAVPSAMDAHPHDRTLRILSVGCAGGEEPYTLSMTLLEHAQQIRGWDVTIRGCDINPEALKHARRGVYTNWALRATSPHCKGRYFMSSGNRHRIHDDVRHSVSFEPGNALQLYRPELAGTLDVIFFRNVLIYFSPEAIRAAINGVAHLLTAGGYLFLGPAETLRGVSDDFILCHTHETFYYRRKNSVGKLLPYSPFLRASAANSQAIADSLLPDEAAPSVAAPAEADTTWMEEIERSAERIRGLHDSRSTRTRSHPAVAAHEVQRRTPAEEIQHLLSLLSEERYEEIVGGVSSLPAELQTDADVRLLLALAHLNRREIAEAETVSRAVLGRDSMNGSGHYILALCREHMRDMTAAEEHDRIAIYLDPSFAMPHLHLALLARKGGHSRVARREFENANLLLARENASRLMMFGGGFTREALRTLCRRELRALGAA